jgi:hypothetical protein
MIARGRRNTRQNLGLRIRNRPARQDRDPAIDVAPIGPDHRARFREIMKDRAKAA